MIKKMGIVFLSLLLLLGSVVFAAEVETITIEGFSEEIFTHNMNDGQQFSGSLSISGGLGDDIIFSVKAPNGTEIIKPSSVSEGTEFEFMANQDGAYTLVFSNVGLLSRTVNLTYEVKTLTIAGLDGTQVLIASFLVILAIVVGIVVIFKKGK
jgi:hypothetical protein